MVIFAENHCKMNIQEIVTPIAKAVEDSFNGLLVPVSDLFNWVVIVGGVIGLFIWLRMQASFIKRDKQEGNIL